MVRSLGISAIAVLAALVAVAVPATAAVDHPGAASSASPSAARSHPASFASLHGVITRISAGHKARFTYTVANLSSGQSAQLQRTFGTARTWKRIEGLPARRNATLTAPALGTLGSYAYRVAIVRSGKPIKTSAPVAVYAYGNVPLAPFCQGGCTGTEQVGSTIFAYTDQAEAGYYPSYLQNAAFAKTSCRSLTVRYAGGDTAQSAGETSYLEFVQSTLDPVYAQTAVGVIGSVTVALDGGPLYIDTATSQSDPMDFVITGSCYTVSGNR